VTYVARSWCAAIALLAAIPARAQNPDLVLSRAERDSILATYDNIFPIWGRKAIERGFALPAPFGLNVQFVWVDQNVEITDLALSAGDNPPQPATFVSLGDVEVPVYTPGVRADLWLLPFLNVYTYAGQAWVTTHAHVLEPVDYVSTSSQKGQYIGVGFTGTIGIKRNFLAVDVNWVWTDTDVLDAPVRGNILAFRYGRAFKLRRNQRLAVWLGALRQVLVANTSGSIALADVIPESDAQRLQAALANYQTSAWYQGLTPAQRVVVDQLIAGLEVPADATVNYTLHKELAAPWNMIVGSSWDITRHWSLRTELGFIKRLSVLFTARYGIDF